MAKEPKKLRARVQHAIRRNLRVTLLDGTLDHLVADLWEAFIHSDEAIEWSKHREER